MSEKSQRALSVFRNPYSCAQAVAFAFKDLSENELAIYKSNSGGKAPDGICGALFAALANTQSGNHRKVIEEFVKQTGAMHCSDIKQIYKTPCSKCVVAATEIAEQNS